MPCICENLWVTGDQAFQEELVPRIIRVNQERELRNQLIFKYILSNLYNILLIRRAK